MIKKMRRLLCFAMLLMLSACGLLGKSAPKAPCAAGIVARYTAEMVAAGCTGEHFDDAKCEPIKAKRDAAVKEEGCR